MKISLLLTLTTFVASSVIASSHVCNPPSIKLKEPPRLENQDSFSMILYGDPQSYTKFTFNQPIFELMTAWTASHKDVLKIKATLCTGDLVDKNDFFLKTTPRYTQVNGDTPSMGMWQNVARSFARLDGVMPYIIATGNHDYGYESSENRNSHFNEYFPILKNKCWQDCLVSTAPNGQGVMSLENSAYEFEDKNWGKILVIALEFAPRDCTLDWAKKLTQNKKYKDHKVIVITHSILETNKNVVEIIEKENYKLPEPNWGKAVLEKLVADSENIKLVLCGHSGDIDRYQSNIDYKTKTNRNVPIVMFNPQNCGGYNANGGDGWLRIMEFMPDGKTISMRTYSPLFASSATTQDFAWDKRKEAQFKIEIQ